MPLDDINKLKSYDEIIAERIAEWEQESIAQIAKEIGKIGKMSKAEAEKYDAKKKAGEQWKQIFAALVAMDALNIKDTKEAYKQAFDEWEDESSALYDYRGAEQEPTDSNTINAYASDTALEMVNLTDTKALCVIDGNGKVIRLQDEIYQAFGEAVKTVTSGDTDFYTAMRQTIKNLGGGGVRVDYGNGITRRLDTVVRQNLLYGIKKANIEYSDRIAKELDCDGYEIDAHNNSRDSHLFMQGKQYCIGEGRTINGVYFVGFEEADPESPDGLSASEALNDYGCRHYRTPIICGISESRFTAEQLQKINDDNTKEYEIDGRKGNRYYWSQKMRALETEIRKSKDEINALKAFGHSVPRINDLRQRISILQAKYNQIAEVTGIDKEPKRLTVQKNYAVQDSGGISGARNPYGEKAQEHANKYYGLVRTMKTDVSKIAKATGFSEDEIQKVKDFIFNDKHDLGGAEKELFEPDYMMSESWQRLIDGKPVAHDITLINHEIIERDLMEQGYTQAEAHIMASKKYNYAKEAAEFYDRIKKYKD